MSVLDFALRYKAQERAAEQAQRAEIGNILLNTFEAPRRRAQEELDYQVRQAQLANIESQTRARGQEDPLSDLLRRAKVAEAAKTLGDRDLYNKVAGRTTVNDFLDPGIADSMPAIPTESPLGRFIGEERAPDQFTGQKTAQPGSLDSFVGEKDPFTGEKTGRAMRAEKAIETQAAVDKSVSQKEATEAFDSEKDLINAELKMNNTFDSYLDVVDETFELTGVKPGLLGGALTTVLGKTKANEFYEAFQGGLVEYAAAVGRTAIPGARAVRMVDLFKGTAPSVFSTIEGAVATTARSMQNALSTDIARNIKEYVPGYEDMSKTEKREARQKLVDENEAFLKEFRERFFRLTYNKNPELLKPETRKKIEQSIARETNILNSYGLDSSEWEVVQ